MPLPGATTKPEVDEVRLLKSGRIQASFAPPISRRVTLRRPTFGEFRKLMELYDALRDEVLKPESEVVEVRPGVKLRPTKEGRDAREVGPRWLTETLALLGEDGVDPVVIDSDVAPSWAINGLVFTEFSRHWMEVPLVSDVSPDPSPTPMETPPTPPSPGPILLRQPPTSGGR
jgi:hypothetical protein